jgi:diguanylate cyclase (GGDEF)-like protein
MPAVALEVVRRTRAAEPDVIAVADAAGKDPALAARLLKLANSSLFGRSRPITNLRQAVMLLGLKNVRFTAISLSLSATREPDRDDPAAPLWRAFRRRAVYSAVTAREYALLRAHAEAEEAFLCGLLMDAGVAVLLNARPEGWTRVLKSFSSGHPDPEVERAALGFTHADLISSMLRFWGLSPQLTEPIRTHHDEANADSASIGAALRCAHLVAEAELGRGSVLRLLASRLNLDDEAARQLHERITRQAKELALIMDMDIGAGAREELALQLVEAQESLLGDNLEQVARTQRAEAEAERLRVDARTDALTGLLNRAAYNEALKHAERKGSLIMFDVDHFKAINDQHGHQAGDAVLRRLGQLVKAHTRDGEAYRFGGEEFAVLAHGASADATVVAERLRTVVASAPSEPGLPACTISLGCATWDEARGDSEALVAIADRRLYAAKRGGRNRTVNQG